jgi:hypothetical protein
MVMAARYHTGAAGLGLVPAAVVITILRPAELSKARMGHAEPYRTRMGQLNPRAGVLGWVNGSRAPLARAYERQNDLAQEYDAWSHAAGTRPISLATLQGQLRSY